MGSNDKDTQSFEQNKDNLDSSPTRDVTKQENVERENAARRDSEDMETHRGLSQGAGDPDEDVEAGSLRNSSGMGNARANQDQEHI